ncbi:TLDc domain-containing protein [Heracleum sosnowskyi]|uniref:TLDc domain-containing protein n=1 Tax=Heracleum sosnowskyi TaxID=360622 RepID=A0AAD8IV85_9APIA|nr:TLDc domain-containing protein [Heracleum sosnowskyi]
MGASSSTEHDTTELREAESLAASTGGLSLLQNVFSNLSDPQTHTLSPSSLQQSFGIDIVKVECEAIEPPIGFAELLNHVGSSIVDLFFMAEKGGINWLEFLRGYTKCCGRTSASNSLNTLFRVFAMAAEKAGLSLKLEFEFDDTDCKMTGSLLASDLLMLLWVCWVMSWHHRNTNNSKQKANYILPDLNHMVLSAVESCSDISSDSKISNLSELNVELPAGKIHLWALRTVPFLADSFGQFVQAKLRKAVSHEDNLEKSGPSVGDISSTKCNTCLLTPGRAWAVSLNLRSTLHEEIVKTCFPNHAYETDENLLYRSGLHGRGLNRFWANVEGYKGPVLMLIAASSGDAHEGGKEWIIGALTDQGFENKDTFYGTSGSLYALSPVFHTFSSSGREKNFIYSHLHPTDFARVTLNHHALDKTYQPGSLCPAQGYLPLQASVLDVEVWGLGGRSAKEVQNANQKREDLFTEQRRKIDLKTFSNWEDSPEKMMMDMMNNPNTVQREER